MVTIKKIILPFLCVLISLEVQGAISYRFLHQGHLLETTAAWDNFCLDIESEGLRMEINSLRNIANNVRNQFIIN